jgi:hypothetical protein
MTTPPTLSRVPAWLREGLCILIILLLSVSLLACSSSSKKKDESPEQLILDAADARKTGPLPGDVRVINGVEWVYGRNVKYMDTPDQPLNIWVPREYYSPSVSDTMPGRVGYPTKKTKETLALEERLAKLEAQVRGMPPPKTPSPDQPVKDATGKAWTRYFRNDDGVEWFLEEAPPSVSGNTLTMWRRRTFPTWAFQKEIVTLDELNCRQARYRTRELKVTNWDGSSQTSDKVTPWAPVISNSPEDYLMKELCK